MGRLSSALHDLLSGFSGVEKACYYCLGSGYEGMGCSMMGYTMMSFGYSSTSLVAMSTG